MGFGHGFASPFRGFFHLLRHPALWRVTIPQIALHLLLMLFAIVFLVLGISFLAIAIHQVIPEEWHWHWKEAIVLITAGMMAIAVTGSSWLAVSWLVCGSFQTSLARHVGKTVRLSMVPLDENDWYGELFQNLRGLAWMIGGNLTILLLHFIPVIGSIAAILLGLWFNWNILGTEYCDFPWNLKGFDDEQKKEWAKSYRGQLLGLGASVFFLNFIPFVGSLMLTCAVIGSVLLYDDLEGIKETPKKRKKQKKKASKKSDSEENATPETSEMESSS
ncbi:Hypothetical protein PBC10988_40490 [Planctomycetales bacterium 10988]|nr:Hypothetical protein PBC10988_40490 [Planctomycetales bacterium 10988]